MGAIAKQSIRGTVVNYLGVFVGFLTTFFVLTRFLTAEEIGLARVLIDTATLFMGLAQLGTSSSIIRFFPYFKDTSSDRSAHGFFFWTVTIPLLGFCIVALLFWLFQAPLKTLFIDKSPLFVHYYYAVLPMAFFMLYQTVFETNSNVLMRIVFPKFVRELLLRLILLVAYLCYAFHLISIDGLVLFLCLSYGIAALCNIIYLFLHGHISLRPNFHYVDRSLARRYFTFTLFQIFAAVATVLTPTISAFFITSQMGLEFTGIFAIATYIAAMVSIPNRSLNAIANPEIAQTLKDQDMSGLTVLVKKLSTTSLLVGAAIFSLIWLNVDLIFHVLPNGATYLSARYVVLFLSLTQLIIATFGVLNSVLNFSRYYYLALVFSFLLTIASLLLNNYLIPLYGINGSALANLFAYSLYFALLCVVVWLCCRVSPFAPDQLKALLIFGLLLVACSLFDRLLPSLNLWLASFVKTLLWALALLASYAWQVSPDINATVRNMLRQYLHH